MKTNRVVAIEGAVSKLLTYRHPAPSHLKATPEQVEGFACFVAWRRLLSRGLLQQKSWIKAREESAMANAEKEEKAAQYAALVKWTT